MLPWKNGGRGRVVIKNRDNYHETVDKSAWRIYNKIKDFRGEAVNLIRSILIGYGCIAVLSVILYIPKLVQYFYAFKRPPHVKATKKRKIALVIPARRESAVIGDLFDSILKQDYDREFFDINVIVKEEDDPTVEMAKAIGANVFVVKEQNCKGAALDGYFKTLGKEGRAQYDAFVIIDADAVISPDYVSELNNALEHDFQIFLTRKFIKNYLGDRKSRTIISNCSALNYPMLDDLGNNYRTKHGIPLMMCGQGMMLRRAVIDELDGWPYRTLTEDYELKMDCLLKGFTSMYYPYAVIYTEEVKEHKEGYTRRLRWVTGFSQCDKLYKKKIKGQAKQRGRYTAGEFEYLFSLYPLILFIVITILTMFIGCGLAVWYATHGIKLWARSLILLTAMPFGIMYLLVFFYCSLAMLAYRDAFKPLGFWEKLGTLLFAPIFMLEYFPIFIQSRFLAKTSYDWTPISRNVYQKGEAAKKAADEQKKRTDEEESGEKSKEDGKSDKK